METKSLKLNANLIENAEFGKLSLFDLTDLMNLFKVSKRTLFNWRSKGVISLIEFGGKLYMTPAMLEQAIAQKGGSI